MYSEVLSITEKTVLLTLLRSIAASDGVVHAHEAEFIEASAAVMGLPCGVSQVPPSKTEVTQALDEVTSRRAQRIILMELINIAFADGEYCDVERSYVASIAEHWTINSNQLAEIEAWVTEGIAWTLNGRRLFSEEM